MQTITKITLDTQNSEKLVRVIAKQGDQGSRYISVSVTEDGKPFSVTTDMQARMRCLRKDGAQITTDAAIQTGNTILARIPDEVMALPGLVLADITLFDQEGTFLSTLIFTIQVKDAPLGSSPAPDPKGVDALLIALARLDATIAKTELVRKLLDNIPTDYQDLILDVADLKDDLTQVSESITEISDDGGNLFDSKKYVLLDNTTFNGTQVYNQTGLKTIAIKLRNLEGKLYVGKEFRTSTFKCAVFDDDNVTTSSKPLNYKSGASLYSLEIPVSVNNKWLIVNLYNENLDSATDFSEVIASLVVSENYYSGHKKRYVPYGYNEIMANIGDKVIHDVNHIVIDELYNFHGHDLSVFRRYNNQNVGAIVNNQLVVESQTSSTNYGVLYLERNLKDKYVAIDYEGSVTVVFANDTLELGEFWGLTLTETTAKLYRYYGVSNNVLVQEANTVRLNRGLIFIKFENGKIILYSDYKYVGSIEFGQLNVPNQIGLYLRFTNTKVNAFGMGKLLPSIKYSMYDRFVGTFESNNSPNAFSISDDGTEYIFNLDKKYGKSNVGSYRTEYGLGHLLLNGYSYQCDGEYEICIDSNMKESENYPFAIGQIHEKTDWGFALSPIFAIYAEKNKLYVGMNQNPIDYDIVAKPDKIQQNSSKYYLSDIDYDTYHKISFKLRIGSTESMLPYVEVYYDDELKMRKNIPIGFQSRNGNYFKFGLYAWSWEDENSPTLGTVRYKNLKFSEY